MTRFQGLKPSQWICVGQGYSREDLKASLLATGQGFVAAAVGGLDELCLRIIHAAGRAGAHEKPVISSLARQEILRVLLADARLRRRFPEICALKRQGGFWRRLDRALQSGRLAFAHPEEAEVFEERLVARTGSARPLRNELRLLAQAYEVWLKTESYWDLPLLLSEATEVLEQGWPERLSLPESVLHWTTEAPESREQGFWDALTRHVKYERTGHEESARKHDSSPLILNWERWHTLDDCAEALAESVTESPAGRVVLIPDDAPLRRSFKRACTDWGVEFSDPRDPTRIRWDEGLKRALFPLELVARGFEREKVVAWLQAETPNPLRLGWVKEIQARGIRGGRLSYVGGKLAPLEAALQALERGFGGRKTCAELGQAHLLYLEQDPRNREALPFFEGLWKKFAEDLVRIKKDRQPLPLLIWLERVKQRLNETPPPLARERPILGLDVYRLHQGVPPGPRRMTELVCLAPPSDWLTRESVGDDWFTEREREILSGEFAVRSKIQAAAERLVSLRNWFAQSERVRVLDPEYDFDGRERESAGALLAEIARGLAPSEPRTLGAHSRWRPSYRAERLPPIVSAYLSPLPARPDGSPPSLSATALDHYSRCGFLALAYDRWRLSDLQEPSTELWPNVRGNLLHRAVRILTQNRMEEGEGGFAVSIEEALDQAWREDPPEGVLRGTSIERLIKARLLLVLRAFSEREREYIRRSGARTIAFDDRKFSLTLASAEIHGKPDRIDENENGFFIIDYKSSGTLPHGEDMVSLGYRLQLPFYALASQAELAAESGKEVLGLQFVELTRGAGRTRGIFFGEHNGKEPGRFTNARSNSRSLLAGKPAESWSLLLEHLETNAAGFVAGRFEAAPKKVAECATCRVSDLCGLRRRGGAGDGGID